MTNEYNLSEYTVRRQYNQWMNITLKGRSDKGSAKVASLKEIEQWVTMVAAVQLATLNKKGRMCSTRRAIEILEDGITYENKTFQLPYEKLTVPTANRWLRTLRIREGKKFRQLVPIHFRAEHSNELWQVDVSPSDRAAGRLKKASRAKGKIERKFLVLKEDFESLFHFHRPRNVDEANDWLFKYLVSFNFRPHPEPGVNGSCMDVWINGLPDDGYRKICSEDTFWSYVAEPEYYVVGPDARIIMGKKA